MSEHQDDELNQSVQKIVHGVDASREQENFVSTIPTKLPSGEIESSTGFQQIQEAQAEINTARAALENARQAQGVNFYTREANSFSQLPDHVINAERTLADLENRIATTPPPYDGVNTQIASATAEVQKARAVVETTPVKNDQPTAEEVAAQQEAQQRATAAVEGAMFGMAIPAATGGGLFGSLGALFGMGAATAAATRATPPELEGNPAALSLFTEADRQVAPVRAEMSAPIMDYGSSLAALGTFAPLATPDVDMGLGVGKDTGATRSMA